MANGLLTSQGIPLNQLYGLLAKYGDDPMQAGLGYAQSQQRQQQLMQAQQRLAQQQAAQEQQQAYRQEQLGLERDKLGLARQRHAQTMQQLQDPLAPYGKINPFDFDPRSIAEFHRTYQTTKDPAAAFEKLRRKPTPVVEKALQGAITAARESEADLGQMSYLANKFDEFATQGIPQGQLVGGMNEWLRKQLGTEDAVTLVRTQYEQLKNKAVVQNLPPGVASDRDIELAMRGWPGSVADPAHISAFLKGMQKLRAIDHMYSTHAASYLGAYDTQKGQWGSWKEQAPVLAEEALQPFGGINVAPLPTPAAAAAPRKPFSEMTADELIEYTRKRYGQ